MGRMSGVRGRRGAPGPQSTEDPTASGMAALAASRSRNSVGHHVPQRDRNLNDIALRHDRSRLRASRIDGAYGERDTTVTTALTLQPGTGSGDEFRPRRGAATGGVGGPDHDAVGDDPAGSARCLARRARAGTGIAAPSDSRPPGAVRPGVRHRRSWSPRKLRAAGLEPVMLAKGNGVICDIGAGERVVALRADLDALAPAGHQEGAVQVHRGQRVPRVRPRRAHHDPGRCRPDPGGAGALRASCPVGCG